MLRGRLREDHEVHDSESHVFKIFTPLSFPASKPLVQGTFTKDQSKSLDNPRIRVHRAYGALQSPSIIFHSATAQLVHLAVQDPPCPSLFPHKIPQVDKRKRDSSSLPSPSSLLSQRSTVLQSWPNRQGTASRSSMLQYCCWP